MANYPSIIPVIRNNGRRDIFAVLLDGLDLTL